MKKTILSIFIVLLALKSYAQHGIQSAKVSADYTWRNRTQSELNEFYFGIKPIEQSAFKYHFRHQRDGQIVDIYSNDGEDFSGNLINKIIEYKYVKTYYGKQRSCAKRYVFETVALSKDSAAKIGKLILNEKFYLIPTDTLIKGWNFQWFDCSHISFIYKTDRIFQYSKYTCYWHQKKSIEQIAIIKTMYDTISQILDLKQRYAAFTSKLEQGKMYSPNGFVMLYVMPKKQALAYKRGQPQREYLKSMKDSIDNSLNATLSKQVKCSEIECTEDYQLIFNENGKLGKVEVSSYYRPKLSDGLNSFFEEKRAIRKCKKHIKKIFRENNLSSLNLKYKVDRTLHFGLNGDMYLSDDTIY